MEDTEALLVVPSPELSVHFFDTYFPPRSVAFNWEHRRKDYLHPQHLEPSPQSPVVTHDYMSSMVTMVPGVA